MSTGEPALEVEEIGLAFPERVLFIVHQLVHAHGGRIEVRSTAEEGTTFTVRLPHQPRAGIG